MNLTFRDLSDQQELETDDAILTLEIADYDIENDSFDHAFGTHQTADYIVPTRLRVVAVNGRDDVETSTYQTLVDQLLNQGELGVEVEQ